MGANAHINGDIWQALTNSFSRDELVTLKPFYKDYNKKLYQIFDELFDAGLACDRRLRNLHAITFGFDKVYGKILLHKWRNRQLKLAIYSFNNTRKFKKMKKRVEHKMQRIDSMITRKLHSPAAK